MKTLQLTTLAVLAMLMALAGCGGGGTSGGGNAPLQTFITDNLDSNDHVWVTIYKVTVNGATPQVAFDDTTGRQVDLKTLRDGSGQRFSLLTSKNIPQGSYNGATVVMDNKLVVYPAGSSVGVPKTFDPSFNVSGGKTQVDFNLSQPMQVGANGSALVIDFDLSRWTDVANVITPVLAESNGNGLGDVNRHERDDFHGTVSNLAGTSPNFEFTLNHRAKGTLTVATNANTVIRFSNDAPNPALANGQRVEVHGRFDSGAKKLLADSIRIENGDSIEDNDQARGNASNLDEAAGAFDLDVQQAENFIPAGNPVRVETNDATKFRAHGGMTMTKAEFFAAVKTAPFVEVEGVYDSGTNKFLAAKIHLEDGEDDHGGGGGGGDEAEARGAASDVSANSGAFSITLVEWFGFSAHVGDKVGVTTSGNTVFRDANHNTIQAEAFFNLIQGGAHAKAEGMFNGTAIVARKCEIDD